MDDFIDQLGPMGENLPAHALVQLYRNPDEDERALLCQSGIERLQYIPNKTWYAVLECDFDLNAGARELVRWMGAIETDDKISDHVKNGDHGPWCEGPNGTFAFVLFFHTDTPMADADAVARAHGAEPFGSIESQHALYVLAGMEAVESIASEDSLLWIDFVSPPFGPLNDDSRTIIHSGGAEGAYGITGQDVDIFIYDVGIVDVHPDLASRIIHWERLPELGLASDHATHVAGTAAGDGTNNLTFRGMAPDARIISRVNDAPVAPPFYNNPTEMEDDYTVAISVGADCANNSLGCSPCDSGYPCDWNGDYEQSAQLIDMITAGSLGRPLPVVWAAGNERGPGCPCGDWITIGSFTANGQVATGAPIGATPQGDADKDDEWHAGTIDNLMLNPTDKLRLNQTSGTDDLHYTFCGYEIT